jgi:opine dehydrogenase
MGGFPKIAVLGAGCGGHAMAADLTLAGFDVRLFELPEFSENVRPIIERGGIEITGAAREGFARIATVTTDVRKALEGANLVMVAVPAFGHETFARIIAPHLNDEQVVVFNTGYFAALRFRGILRSMAKHVVIAENMILPYTCRLLGSGHVQVDGKKKEMYVAALPATDTDRAVGILRNAYPEVKPAANVLKTSLDNLNIVSHSVVTVLNKGLVDRADCVTLPVTEAVTPSVGKVMDAVDKERAQVGNALGVKVSPIKEMLEMWGYKTHGDTVYENYQNCEPFQKYSWKYVRGSHQYLREDLTYGLVPLASLGDLVSVSTPTIDATIQLFSIMDEVDYKTLGITSERMGLAGLTLSQIQGLLSNGTVQF